MERKKLFELIGIGCSGLGFLLTLIFGIVSCNMSADNLMKEQEYSGSLMYIVVVVAMLISVAGAVMAFLSMTKGEKPSIFVIIAFACTAVAILLGTIPHITICAYNCSLESSAEEAVKEAIGGYSSWFN